MPTVHWSCSRSAASYLMQVHMVHCIIVCRNQTIKNRDIHDEIYPVVASNATEYMYANGDNCVLSVIMCNQVVIIATLLHKVCVAGRYCM